MRNEPIRDVEIAISYLQAISQTKDLSNYTLKNHAKGVYSAQKCVEEYFSEFGKDYKPRSRYDDVEDEGDFNNDNDLFDLPEVPRADEEDLFACD